MRVLVTGANGLLGHKLAVQLQTDPGLQSVLTGRGPHRHDLPSLEYADCELTSPEQVQEMVNWSKPDYIIHAAAMTQVDECELDQKKCLDCNVNATKYLLEAADHQKAGFQYISTDFVFDGGKGHYSETDAPAPISHYGASKLAAEELVKSSGLDWSIVRTVLVYGYSPHMSRSNLVLWVRESLMGKKTIKVVTDQWRTPTLAEDLAKGCSQVLKHHALGIFHVSGDESLTPYQMAMQTAKRFGLDRELIQPVDASTFTQPGKRPPKTGFNIEKARQELGFHPLGFDHGLTLVKAQIESGNERNI